MPEVSGVSQSRLLTSVGNAWGGFLKYKGLRDSALVLLNIVDENYIPLHGYKLIVGHNFITKPVTKDATSELIVNEKTLKQFNIGNGDPEKAIGEEVLLNNKKLTIVGVIKDFHYSKLDSNIEPVVFTYLTPDAFLTSDGRDGLVNVRVNTDNPIETMAKIQEVWKSVDPVHPFDAQFYEDSIEDAYNELSAMIKVIGFLSFIAISIASLGLLGMVVFTTETRIKEISIRKVLGASAGNLVLLLSHGFVIMLAISALIALPITYIFFENIVLTNFPFHDRIGIAELFGGLLAVLAIAFIMIGSQTIRAAQRNPAEILKSE
jgi:ABC-type antimicrobial peptide transport system permease subunit